MSFRNLVKMVRDRWNREQVYSKADYWDSKASLYDGDAVSMWENNNLNKLYHVEHMKFVDRHLSDIENQTILDVGCGTGYMSRNLARKGGKVTAIDFSAKTIDLAKAESISEGIDFRVMSAFDIDYESKFDIVFMWGCSVVAAKDEEELSRILGNLFRSLKPGGKILILEPIHKGFLHFVLNMNLKEYCGAVDKAGFSIQSITQLHFWPFRFLLAYVQLPAFFTTPFYRLGQFFLRLPVLSRMGDYKGIFAVKA